ncbi:MAG: universal stress protein [Mycetocola sp.]
MTTSALIVVGVVPNQSERVLTEAVRFAQQFEAELLIVNVDPARYPVGIAPDGSIVSALATVDVSDYRTETFDPELAASVAAVLDPTGVTWSTFALVGDPVRSIAGIARQRDAEMIIVGTRPPTVRAAIAEFFAGSVAAGLAHRQSRPVVVVPRSRVYD